MAELSFNMWYKYRRQVKDGADMKKVSLNQIKEYMKVK
jgi:hypothetical protein